MIYDAAHSFGEEYDHVGVGMCGDASVFSFHATKVFNSIEGWAVVCKEHNRYESLYNLKNFGIRGDELVVAVGANAKMNEFSAIMGLCNLKHVDEAIRDRQRVYRYYTERLNDITGIRILTITKNDYRIKRNYAYMPIVIGKQNSIAAYQMRDIIHDLLQERGIHARKYFYPITADQACFKNKYKGDRLDISRDISKRILSLPIYEGLDEEIIDIIVQVIRNEMAEGIR